MQPAIHTTIANPSATISVTVDTSALRATELTLYPDTENQTVINLTGTALAMRLGASPWLIERLTVSDTHMLHQIVKNSTPDAALGYLHGLMDSQARAVAMRAQELAALRAAVAVTTAHPTRIIETPETALYVAHASTANHQLYLTATENPYGNPDVSQDASRTAPSTATLLICEPVSSDTHVLVLAELDWPLTSTRMTENQALLNELAAHRVLIEQLTLVAMGHTTREQRARAVAQVQDVLLYTTKTWVTQLATMRHPAATTDDPHTTIVITPATWVTEAAGTRAKMLMCSPDSPRYAKALDTIWAHDDALVRAMNQDMLAAALQRIDTGTWSLLEISEICADLIEAAATKLNG